MTNLATFDNSTFDRGRSLFFELVWHLVNEALVSTWLPGSGWRAAVLRIFGAKVGTNVVLKPRMRVKFPWRLTVGENSWIGEGVWIDNLAQVTIGSNCCISQGAYLCTGSHNWKSDSFDLVTRPITVGDQAWIAARTVVAPGVTIGEGSVLGLGSVATQDLEPWTIYAGNPAVKVRLRSVGPVPL